MLRKPVLLLLGLVGAFVVLAIVAGNLRSSSSMATTSPLASGSLPVAGSSQSELVFDLGTRTDTFGSTWQAQELLNKIQQNPSTRVFVLIAKDTSGAQVEVRANLREDYLTRTHSDTGKMERWAGSVMQRLQTAAKGGSLNDTH